jgi:hypothetical protein
MPKPYSQDLRDRLFDGPINGERFRAYVEQFLDA